MAKIACIPKKYLSKLQEGVKSGEFDIAKMMEMESAERRAIFEKYLPKAEAKFANTQFEKAIVSNRKKALQEWAESTFKGKKSHQKQTVLDKIKSLQNKDLLAPQGNQPFMEDLVMDKLGLSISAEEAQTIVKKAEELEKIKVDTSGESLVNNFDNVVKYLKKYNEMTKYLQSINPSSRLKVFTSIYTRAFMLMSVKSPVVNITGNAIIGSASATLRRMRMGRVKGYNADLRNYFIRKNVKIANETGFDLSRIYSLQEQKILGEDVTSTEGPGQVRKFGRVLEKYVFEKSLMLPDVTAASFHFADSIDLITSQMADKQGLRGDEAKQYARKIMLDAMSLDPQTIQGQEVRQTAMEEAFYGTFTNESKLSSITLNTRKWMNSLNENASVGDMIIPFAKTPANVVASNLDYSGILSVFDIRNIVKGFKQGDKVMIKKATDNLIRAGFGFTAAMLLVGMIDPDDYVSEYADYFPAEKQLIALENATYNSIKIGNKWVSLDYFGPFGSGIVGIMNARKYGNSLPDKVFRYFSGVARQALKIPGFNELEEFLGDIQKTSKAFYKEGIEAGTEDLQRSLAGFTSARVIPAIMSDVAIAIDKFDRKKDSPLSQFMARIPGLREKLPEKIGLFGEEILAQPGPAQFFFGSRVKFAKENNITQEINSLSLSGYMPSISSVEFTSTRAKVLKAFMGANEFNDFMRDLGSNLEKGWTKLINAKAYDKLPDDKKRDMFNKIRTKIVDAMIKKHIIGADEKIRKQIIEEMKK